MFLEYLKYLNLPCHGEQNIIVADRKVSCTECHAVLMDVPSHIASLRFRESSLFVKYYVEKTGDLQIPCKVVLLDVPGIRPTEFEVPYQRLLSAIQLFGVVNGEFFDYTGGDLFQRSLTLRSKIIEHFISNYISMVHGLKYEREDIDSLIKSLLEQMKNVFDTDQYNIIEYYLNVLCPYVKGLRPFRLMERRLDVESAGDCFVQLSRDAVTIRQEFGRFCIPFDIMFVMIYAYLCSSDLELVANFVFDLLARICRGHFDDRSLVHSICENAVAKEISFKNNTDLHYLVKNFREGTVMDLISMEFIEKFSRMQKLILIEFNKHFVAPNATVQSYAFSQAFPFVLFPPRSDYYAFMCAIGFLLRKIDTTHGRFEKGVVANSKRIFRFIAAYTRKVVEFEVGQMVDYWTLDLFKLFLSSDEDLVEKFKEFLELLT